MNTWSRSCHTNSNCSISNSSISHCSISICSTGRAALFGYAVSPIQAASQSLGKPVLPVGYWPHNTGCAAAAAAELPSCHATSGVCGKGPSCQRQLVSCCLVACCPGAVLHHTLWCCPGAVQAFAKGVGPFLEAVQEHDFLHATKLTLMLAAIAVPLNTVFGTVAAILITRNEFPGKVSPWRHALHRAQQDVATPAVPSTTWIHTPDHVHSCPGDAVCLGHTHLLAYRSCCLLLRCC